VSKVRQSFRPSMLFQCATSKAANPAFTFDTGPRNGPHTPQSFAAARGSLAAALSCVAPNENSARTTEGTFPAYG
jgi:hypothetical protein